MAKRKSRINRLRPLAGLLATGLAVPAFAAPSEQFPTYVTGPQQPGCDTSMAPGCSWVVSSGQIITPAGIQVNLGIRVRSKAIAINPNTATHTASVLTEGQGVEVFDTRTGQVLQTYATFASNPNIDDSTGSYSGITYSADGKFLLFSQASSNVTIANVSPTTGLLSDNAYVSVPPNNTFIQCFPNSPVGPYNNACGTFYTPSTSYPGGVAFSKDGKSAYALLNQNDTLTSIDLTANPPVQATQIRVGNAPHSLLINRAGTTAYVSNEGGRAATQADFQIYSAGTPIVADSFVGAAITGTVSVVDLQSMQVTATIPTGLHPTGMAFFGRSLLVANAYSDTISVIDTATNEVVRTIDLGLPVSVPGQRGSAYGAAPNSIAVDHDNGIAYVALYNANAVGVIDLSDDARNPVLGMIPVAYAPSSVMIDKSSHSLIVANDKGIGARNSTETDHGVTSLNTHQDNGTVSIVAIPDHGTLAAMTHQVYQNNHWDLSQNIAAASSGSGHAKPQAIPAKIGDPSTIKHVFLIIRENRTYDQMLGDVAAGNGDASLAVFGGKDSPNAHTLVKRFPLLDNFYDPSRQSADGHQWISEGLAPYADDIQSPYWIRSYPGGNAGDALAYTTKGFLWSNAVKAGLSVKIYGEYVENDYFKTPTGSTAEPSWVQFYNDALQFESTFDFKKSGPQPTLYYQNTITAESSVPAIENYLIKNFPQFDLNIPDQFRVDLWVQDFKKDVENHTVPNLSVLWVMDDHTGGPPSPDAEQADNDLAVGRIIDYISHTPEWRSSAIFIEEDDAQNGVDHVDGHRSPGYIISPYAVQNGPTDHTYYTQVNMTRTIEQILGLSPMNQFDLVASPMITDFVKGEPPEANFAPYDHVLNQIALNVDSSGNTLSANTASTNVASATPSSPVERLKAAWIAKRQETFAGKMSKPDSEDSNIVNHMNWYMATSFTRPYPGEDKILDPSEFKVSIVVRDKDGDGDD
jgi:YVTN family beta-propeller protein